jgi:hypothetical protein
LPKPTARSADARRGVRAVLSRHGALLRKLSQLRLAVAETELVRSSELAIYRSAELPVAW